MRVKIRVGEREFLVLAKGVSISFRYSDTSLFLVLVSQRLKLPLIWLRS